MSYVEPLSQVMIPLLSIMAVAFSQLEVLQRWHLRRYAPWVGLSVQPFWVITGVNKEQTGVLVTTAFFTCLYVYGLYEQLRLRGASNGQIRNP